ncbi:MAG TPA: YdeI/OmpD-associated family protein [Burkholderiaceae bacterium]|nr:YdeI/OmpD-associated family protein [Burkholderiaceae bacterium]
MNQHAETYFTHGCGRCAKGGTPACKVITWAAELAALRALVLDSGLTEECKWGVPCYTVNGGNVVIIHSFKEYCALLFFKGTFLKDTKGILIQQTENVQGGRQLRFTDVREITKLKTTIKACLQEAIAVEKAGLKVAMKPTAEFAIPEEFETALNQSAKLKTAFEALTPGRQRAYLLHFAAAKQAKTREARIEKCTPQIMSGKGLLD